jgi:NTP pyrophosphatase (non-canonical NTP hydrolase)
VRAGISFPLRSAGISVDGSRRVLCHCHNTLTWERIYSTLFNLFLHPYAMTATTDFATLKTTLLKFRDDRNWKQFHTLKNLIISLNLESAELLELTQWKTDDELAALQSDQGFRESLKDECADVLLYLLLVANEAGIDLLDAAAEKIKKNAVRYPADQAYGSAEKYSRLNEKK